CHLFEDDLCFLQCQGTFCETLAECPSFNVWHDKIAVWAMLAIIESWEDMRMFKEVKGFYLTLKPPHVFIIAALDHFESDSALYTLVRGEIDNGHASPR